MAATLEDIRGWITSAPEGATHVIIATDTYDWTDYPVYVMQGEDARAVAGKHGKIMEVYNLSMDLSAQLRERRAVHY